MSTIIKNGTVVTPSDTFNADVKIVDGTISAIAQCIAVTENDRVIDASGQYLFPMPIWPLTAPLMTLTAVPGRRRRAVLPP